jgi:hypothetical protein
MVQPQNTLFDILRREILINKKIYKRERIKYLYYIKII